jgi:hypothetical protein
MRYSQNRKIGKPNNLNFGNNETKEPKYDTVFLFLLLRKRTSRQCFKAFEWMRRESVRVQICSQTSMIIKLMFMVPLSQFHFSQRYTDYHRHSCKIAFFNSAM